MFLFNTMLRRKVEAARKKLCDRLQSIKRLLSDPDLDAKLRAKLEAEEARIKEHLQTRIRKINGGP